MTASSENSVVLSVEDFEKGSAPFLEQLHEMDRKRRMNASGNLTWDPSDYAEMMRIRRDRLYAVLHLPPDSTVRLVEAEKDLLFHHCAVRNGKLDGFSWEPLHACVRGDVRRVLCQEPPAHEQWGQPRQTFRVCEPRIEAMELARITASPGGDLKKIQWQASWPALVPGFALRVRDAVPVLDPQTAKKLAPSPWCRLLQKWDGWDQLNLDADGNRTVYGTVHLARVAEDASEHESFVPWARDVYVPRSDLL